MLSLRNDVDIIALETKPEKAIELIIKKNPDLVFMDIEMPYISLGLMWLTRLKKTVLTLLLFSLQDITITP
jgi:CheY-like chemotaxis protein